MDFKELLFTSDKLRWTGTVAVSRRIFRQHYSRGAISAQAYLIGPTSTTDKPTKGEDVSTSDTELTPAQPGTAPERSAYLVLHTSTPSLMWPSHFTIHSPLLKTLLKRVKPFKGMVNISHRIELSTDSFALPTFGEPSDEAYPATLYRTRGRPPINFASLSSSTVDSLHLDQYFSENSSTEELSSAASVKAIEPTGAIL